MRYNLVREQHAKISPGGHEAAGTGGEHQRHCQRGGSSGEFPACDGGTPHKTGVEPESAHSDQRSASANRRWHYCSARGPYRSSFRALRLRLAECDAYRLDSRRPCAGRSLETFRERRSRARSGTL